MLQSVQISTPILCLKLSQVHYPINNFTNLSNFQNWIIFFKKIYVSANFYKFFQKFKKICLNRKKNKKSKNKNGFV